MKESKNAVHSKWQQRYVLAHKLIQELHQPNGKVAKDGHVRRYRDSPRKLTLGSINSSTIGDADDRVVAASQTPIGRLEHSYSLLLTAVMLVIDNEVPTSEALQAVIDCGPKVIAAVEEAKIQISESKTVGMREKHVIIAKLDRVSIHAKWFAAKAQAELNYEGRDLPWAVRISARLEELDNGRDGL